jgi:predicted nucleotidyltransferase
MGILRRQETAGQHLYTFNNQNRLAPALGDLFDVEMQRANELFERLAEIVSGAGAATSAVVFGSAARGDAGPGSDFDVLVLVTDRESESAIYSALLEASAALENEFGVDLSPVVITVEQALHQKAEGDSFIVEVIRDGRRFFGRPVEEVLRG